MTPDERRVAAQIRDAFRGVVLGRGVGLWQGQAIDDYAGEAAEGEARARDEKEDWSRIPVDLLNGCHSSLCFFDAEGMRFHLPAYLVAELEGTLNQDIVFHLTYDDGSSLSRFDRLSAAQRDAVRQFLLLRVSDPAYEFESPLIQAALGSYWRPC
jgi:hypothetical protein